VPLDSKNGRDPVSPGRSVTLDQPSIASRRDGVMEPDSEQVEAQRVRSLLELAGVYVRQALALPEQVEVLQSITGNLLFENAALRWQLDQLRSRVDVLERRADGSRG
jgi:predicted RecB family endonuclease